MAQRLLIVEKAWSIIQDGVNLDPPYANDRMPQQAHPVILRSQPCPAVLRRPDGTTLACTVRTGSMHVVPIEYSAPHWYSFYWLPEMQPDQVPPGTEVWVEEADLLSPEEIHEEEEAFFREMDELEGKEPSWPLHPHGWERSRGWPTQPEGPVPADLVTVRPSKATVAFRRGLNRQHASPPVSPPRRSA